MSQREKWEKFNLWRAFFQIMGYFVLKIFMQYIYYYVNKRMVSKKVALYEAIFEIIWHLCDFINQICRFTVRPLSWLLRTSVDLYLYTHTHHAQKYWMVPYFLALNNLSVARYVTTPPPHITNHNAHTKTPPTDAGLPVSLGLVMSAVLRSFLIIQKLYSYNLIS